MGVEKMLMRHDRFYSEDGKRSILIVDDEMINREILGMILSEKYDLHYAENGKEAMDILREMGGRIAVVMLDLIMPVMDGYEVIEAMKADEVLRRIPIIVLTSDKSAEVKSLSIGANDYIPKPYNAPEVIMARVQRIIEFAEDREILQSTERNKLSGLLSTEFFYRYADQYDLHHPGREMDAATIDIDHFHLVNELHGWEYGDKIISMLGGFLYKVVDEAGGLAGHQGADIFMLYCPHGTDYEEIVRRIRAGAEREDLPLNMHLRLGAYLNADKSLEIERRFDRAKHASDTIRNNLEKSVAYYDESLHKKEIDDAKLVGDMDKALEERQFVVYYQPKYDITGDKPVLSSAEALIRWKHPERGMISPGVFIPLFEKNGLIQKLDKFVWNEAGSQIKKWKDKYGVEIPVSVNVSRIDLISPDFLPTLQGIVEKNGISYNSYLLEVTESAYTEDSGLLIESVEALRSKGFQIEMDDFGSGYSSLNMLAQMPIDALKLDMKFIRNLQSNQKNEKIMELMIDIAEFLSVPVIAEGVETEEQVKMLKAMGCDIVQGYYFSRPVPPDEFEQFISDMPR